MSDDDSQDSGDESAESEPQEPARSVWEPFAAPGEGDPDPNRHSEEEAYIERGDDEGDLAAKRAALEAEIDRQLAALESVVDTEPDEDEPDEDDAPEEDEAGEAEPNEDDELEDALEELRVRGDIAAVDEDDEEDHDEPPSDEVEDDDAALSASVDGAGAGEPPGRRRRWVPLVAVAAVAAVVIGVVVATGGDDEPGDEPAAGGTSTTAAATVPGSDVAMPAEDALAYFDAYGTQDPDVLEGMLALAAPGSAAHAYAVHQVNLAQIDPQRNSPLDIALDGDTIEACPQDDDDADCITYADFTATAEGLLTHFTINGSPLRDRVAVGTGSEVTAGPMTISIVTSYLSVSDRLFVVYLVRNDGAAPISPTDVRYLSPAGERIDPDNDTFRDAVDPGTFRIAAAAFPTTARGGTLAIDASSDESGQFQAAITVP